MTRLETCQKRAWKRGLRRTKWLHEKETGNGIREAPRWQCQYFGVECLSSQNSRWARPSRTFHKMDVFSHAILRTQGTVAWLKCTGHVVYAATKTLPWRWRYSEYAIVLEIFTLAIMVPIPTSPHLGKRTSKQKSRMVMPTLISLHCAANVRLQWAR